MVMGDLSCGCDSGWGGEVKNVLESRTARCTKGGHVLLTAGELHWVSTDAVVLLDIVRGANSPTDRCVVLIRFLCTLAAAGQLRT